MTNTEPNRASRIIRQTIGVILLIVWLAAIVLSSENVARELAGSPGVKAAKELDAAMHAIRGMSMLLSTIAGITLAIMFRRRLVGGWLLFFYLSMAGSVIESTMQIPATLEELRALEPGSLSWTMADDVCYVLSVSLAGLAATVLLLRRHPFYVRLLLAALVGSIAAVLINQVTIRVYGSTDSNALRQTITNISEVIVLTAWFEYFRKSKRVQGFTGQSTWTYDWQAGGRRTRHENYYVAARVAGSGIAVLSVSWVLIRLLLPRTAEYFHHAPSAMVVLTLPPAVKAAVISYFAPISDRVRALLTAK